MNNKVDKTKLGYLGEDFQYKLIKTFFEDPNFFKDLNTIIDQNAFTEAYLRTIVGVMKEYCSKYESTPSYDIVEIKLNEKSNTEDEQQYYTEAMEKIKKTDIGGYKEIEDMSYRFFSQQNLIKVANEIKIIASDGDIEKYDTCRKMVEDALSVCRKEEETTTPFSAIEDDLCPEGVVTIPTGIERLDEGLGGGLDKGKIGLIICPMGAGKTSMTTCISANAATIKAKANNYEGYKVLQVCFEDKPRDIRRKYISKITGVETSKLNSSQSVTDEVREILKNSAEKEMINNNVKILKLNTGEITATDIKNKINKLKNEGFKADLVIVDYFECLVCERGMSRDDITTREGSTMRKFETMAEELDVAMWIPTQGNRDSISAELVTNDKVGGSIRKNQIAQVVLSVTRGVDGIKNKRAVLTILKNRTGQAGLTLNNVWFDNGTCTIKTDNIVEFDDALAYNEYAERKDKENTQKMEKSLMEKIKDAEARRKLKDIEDPFAD